MTYEEAVIIKEMIEHYYINPPLKKSQIETQKAFSKVISELLDKITDILVVEFDKNNWG